MHKTKDIVNSPTHMHWATWLDGFELRIVFANGDHSAYGYISGSENRWFGILVGAVNQALGKYTHPTAAIRALEAHAKAQTGLEISPMPDTFLEWSSYHGYLKLEKVHVSGARELVGVVERPPGSWEAVAVCGDDETALGKSDSLIEAMQMLEAAIAKDNHAKNQD